MNETQANQPAYLASTGINVSSPQKALPEHHTYHAIAHDIKMLYAIDITNNKQIVCTEKIQPYPNYHGSNTGNEFIEYK